LENVQRRAALICTGAYRHTEHITLLNELGWESLTTRRYYKRLTTYYTLLNGPTPAHILPHIPPTVQSSTQYNLRNRSNLRPPHTRLQSSFNSFFPKTARDWNNLPIPIRASLTLPSFKRAMKPKSTINPYTLVHFGRCGAWIARIRMGLSALNAQRFSYNLTDSDKCATCPNSAETPLHYLWECHAHETARTRMMDRVLSETSIEQINKDNILSLLIFGETVNKNHSTLFDIVSEYTKTTARFR
jgi:hypothetical protein